MVVILVIALLIFGPRKLPELAKSLGKGLSELRRTSTDLRRTLEREIHQEGTDGKPPVGGLPGAAPAAVPTSLATGAGREAAPAAAAAPAGQPVAGAPPAESSTWPDGRPGRPASGGDAGNQTAGPDTGTVPTEDSAVAADPDAGSAPSADPAPAATPSAEPPPVPAPAAKTAPDQAVPAEEPAPDAGDPAEPPDDRRPGGDH
jgi:sec-independent protein translocase protein TatB